MKSAKYIFLISLLAISGCNAEDMNVITQSIDGDSIWVYAQFNIPEKEKIEDYFFFGRISEPLYEEIIDGRKTNGFILLRDVRYWNTDAELLIFEDESDTGDIVFRIEHLVRLELKKDDPVLQQPEEIVEPVALEETANQELEPTSLDAD